MKHFIFTLMMFFIMGNIVFADNVSKYTSFCGVKFGSKPLKKHTFISRTDDGNYIYRFKPKKYFMNFKECGFITTPISKKIAQVFLINRIKGIENAANYAEHVKNVLQNHYKVEPKKNNRSLEPEYHFQMDGFHLMLKVQFKVMESIVQIIATDIENFNLMQKEEKEYTAKNIDTSAL